jgi:hypothetical protein
MVRQVADAVGVMTGADGGTTTNEQPVRPRDADPGTTSRDHPGTDAEAEAVPPDVLDTGPTDRDNRRRAWRLADLTYWFALAGLVLAGLAGQVRVWASDRGLWGDEMYVAVNFRDLRFGELAGPLFQSQVAPPGWLAMERAVLLLFGQDERVLKAPELVAAAAVLVLAAAAAHLAIGRWGALVTAALLTISPYLYYYAGELKQYAFEAGVAMVILAMGGWYGRAALDRPLPRWRHAVVFAVVTATVTAGSYSALVVLAGVAAGIGLLQAIHRRWRGVLVTALAAAPGLAVGATQAYLRFRVGVSGGQYTFFARGFPPEGAGWADLARWLPDMWHWFVVNPMSWRYSPAVLVLAVAGLASLIIRRRPLWAAMMGFVFLMAIGAGALRGFPLEGRVAVYLIAPTVLAVAAAVDGAVRLLAWAVRRPGVSRRLGYALPSALLVIATVAAVAYVVRPAAVAAHHQVEQPLYRDAGRDMLREVRDRIQPGDVVIGYNFSHALLRWYGPQYGLRAAGLAGLAPQTRAGCDPDAIIKALNGANRVWYVHGAPRGRHPPSYQTWVVAELAKYGTVVERGAHFTRAGWTLIDLRAGPDPDPPPASTDKRYFCLRFTEPPPLLPRR